MDRNTAKMRIALKENGWELVCQSPLEIRHKDGSFATMQAANIVVSEIIAHGNGYMEENDPVLQVVY